MFHVACALPTYLTDEEVMCLPAVCPGAACAHVLNIKPFSWTNTSSDPAWLRFSVSSLHPVKVFDWNLLNYEKVTGSSVCCRVEHLQTCINKLHVEPNREEGPVN